MGRFFDRSLCEARERHVKARIAALQLHWNSIKIVMQDGEVVEFRFNV